MNERYIKWWTPHLSRDFEMLVVGDGHGTPLVLFPTSFGRYSQNKDFGLTDSIAGFVDSGKITIYCPDSADLDSFYNKAILGPEEPPPELQSPCITVAGLL